GPGSEEQTDDQGVHDCPHVAERVHDWHSVSRPVKARLSRLSRLSKFLGLGGWPSWKPRPDSFSSAPTELASGGRKSAVSETFWARRTSVRRSPMLAMQP